MSGAVFAPGGIVFAAPVGTPLSGSQDWIPLGHTASGLAISGYADAEPHEDMQAILETLDGRRLSWTFTMKRRDIRRLVKFATRRTPLQVRRSAMRSEYHRRAKHR